MEKKRKKKISNDEIVLLNKLNHVFDRLSTKELISDGMEFRIENAQSTFIWHRTSGDRVGELPYALFNVSTLYTVACMFKLIDLHKLSLDDPLSKYLEESVIKQLQKYRGKTYEKEITIQELLHNTSGIPDYFVGKNKQYKTIKQQLPEDTRYQWQDILSIVKEKKATFAPGKKCKYSRTNGYLLGMILEKVCDLPLSDIYDTLIYEPLGLKQTYLYQENHVYEYGDLYYRGMMIQIPNILRSEQANGGQIATMKEVMRFLKAFFSGELFNKEHLEEMQDFRRIAPGVRYGLGMMERKIGGEKGIGFSGDNGSLCYYIPAYDLFACGIINEYATSKPIHMLASFLKCFR